MKNIRVLITIIVFVFITSGCGKNKPVEPKINEYSNPILQGFYPDPSICKAHDSYYLVNSTFAYFPGIPIFKSNDLVNWEQIGNVLDRPEQLDLDGLDVSRGVFAPAIRYNNGIYYVTCTIVAGKNNFFVTATNPEGPWSNPIWLPEVEGIDPSLFFDDNGKVYIIYNSDAPDKKPLYEGHRTIKMYEIDVVKGSVVGEPIILVNGGSDFSKKPIWIEGPHIYKKNSFYYLLAAEGGTAEDHSEVVFRSENVKGPYISYKNNPILSQRHLKEDRPNPITSVGHADIIEDANGDWWGVFLGCRPYEDNHYNTGRETFMAPVKWENNWPVFDLGGDVVKQSYPTPNNIVKQKESFKHSGNYTFKEEFDNAELDFEWLFLRTPREKWYNISNGSLQINTRSESVSNLVNPSFIGYRQQHSQGSVSTEMDFNTSKENEKAGLIAFQNNEYFYYMCKSVSKGKPVIQLFQSTKDSMKLLVEKPLKSSASVKLKIEAKGSAYSFLYAEEQNQWKTLKDNVNARFLSTKTAGGFVGTIYAMYTTSLGEESKNVAQYNWFQIENIK
ncbi:alpha-N-arabinofuranosidase [Lutibacter oricola]|uniref:Alpha-N-arabinofuranosidase n=1 Tax=Lutibacter oricola TaxID=762486 RepID=A0A1H2VPX3_9FLAO|nr:glycoside hydrolase family 43 protein [Lutibacter oricola]SDW70405.1 alpha-N-arabinofuranosidase [Lutibacter oricola]